MSGTRSRMLLAFEFALGVLPALAFYVYHFPVGVFWVRSVLELACAGRTNLFTTSIALMFVAGGLGLLSLCVLMLSRWSGRRHPGRLLLAGLGLGLAASLGLLIIDSVMGAYWIDYYVLGAPLLIGAHQLYAASRISNRIRKAAAASVILVLATSSAAAADPPRFPRVAAEWEPALGAMLAWPPVVPDALLVEIAEDDRLFLLVEDAEMQAEAGAELEGLGIDLGSVEFIIAGGSEDLAWTRDWGPFALFDEHGGHHFADPRFVDYPQSTPDCDGRLYTLEIPFLFDPIDDTATQKVARALGFSNVQLPFAFTGGNALVDGHGTAFSTCVMLNENRRTLGISREEFHRAVEARLGISSHVVIPNFEWFGIQHIDCLLKPLDEETILVKRVPKDHPDHGPIEEIVNHLASLTNPHGRPYRILRIDTPPYLLDYFVANYTNSLILNRKVLVPLFGISADEKALETWREAMPGYEVIGFENPGILGWSWYDALHCRARAIWDPEMLYMHHRRLDDRVEPADSYTVRVSLRDHSRKGLIDEELELSWRLRGKMTWRAVPLEREGLESEAYVASIPSAGVGSTVEYFLSAADRSGRRETLPRGAPVGFYSFTIDAQTR